MQRSFNTQAIILSKKPAGENDATLILYCTLLGKIYAIAKGARKISSSWSGHLEPMNICQIQLYKSQTRFTITQCRVEQNFKNIYKNMENLSIALLVLEILQKSTHGQEHGPELFNLIKETFSMLNIAKQPFLILEQFKLHLLELNGALPNMTSCASCHQRWNHGTEISLDQYGHFICKKCLKTEQIEAGHDLPLRGPYNFIAFEIMKLVCYFLKKNQPDNIKIHLSISQKQQLQLITHTFLQHFLDREIIGEKIHEKMTAV